MKPRITMTNQEWVRHTVAQFVAEEHEMTDTMELRHMGLDSLERIQLEVELEADFELDNPKSKNWIGASDSIESVTRKIENWKP